MRPLKLEIKSRRIFDSGLRRCCISQFRHPGMWPDVLDALGVHVDRAAPLGTFAQETEIHRQG